MQEIRWRELNHYKSIKCKITERNFQGVLEAVKTKGHGGSLSGRPVWSRGRKKSYSGLMLAKGNPGSGILFSPSFSFLRKRKNFPD